MENRTNQIQSFYGDLKVWIDLARNATRGYYSTQPVNLIYALDAALDQMLAEGLDRRIRRHRIIA